MTKTLQEARKKFEFQVIETQLLHLILQIVIYINKP